MRRVSFVLVLSVALAACSKRGVDVHEKRIADLDMENRALRQQVSDLEKRLAAPVGVQPEPSRSPSPTSGSKEPFLRVEDSPAYRNLSGNLAESNRLLEEARARLRAMEEQIAVTTEENQKLGAAQRELQTQLAQAGENLEAARKDVASREQRIQQAEETARKLKADSTAASQKNSQLLKVLDELEDIHRRREAAANNLYGRYRDLNEFLRSLSLTVQTSNEGSAQTDLSRIQQLISMADEDMRQLRSLNAQAARANKKLASVKP
jgi:chromosome segregation ATPase